MEVAKSGANDVAKFDKRVFIGTNLSEQDFKTVYGSMLVGSIICRH